MKRRFFCTVLVAAKLAGLSKDRIRQLLHEGKLRRVEAHTTNRVYRCRYYVERGSLLAYIRSPAHKRWVALGQEQEHKPWSRRRVARELRLALRYAYREVVDGRYTLQRASELLGISPASVIGLCDAGRLLSVFGPRRPRASHDSVTEADASRAGAASTRLRYVDEGSLLAYIDSLARRTRRGTPSVKRLWSRITADHEIH